MAELRTGRLQTATTRTSAPTTSPANALSRWVASTWYFNLTQALVDPGDEVVIPVPYWVTYQDVVHYAGGKCVFAETDEEKGSRSPPRRLSRTSPRGLRWWMSTRPQPSGAVMDLANLRSSTN